MISYKMKNSIKDFLFSFYVFRANFFNKIKKYNYNVAIVSSDERKNKLKDDIYLKCVLNKKNVKTDIISWKDKNINYQNYDLIIIRSVWGFQKEYSKFLNWLDNIKKFNIKIVNNLDIINDNIDKEKQYNILVKNDIPVIETNFINRDKNLQKQIETVVDKNNWKKYVLKPAISEGSQDTYVIGDNNITKNSITKDEINSRYSLLDSNIKIMIQPFLDGVFDGEISVICINNEVKYAVKRYNGVFKDINLLSYIELKDIDKEIIDICQKIKLIKEYSTCVYSRIDFIKHENKYYVLEVEMLDPNIYISNIKNVKYRKKFLDEFSNYIITNL